MGISFSRRRNDHHPYYHHHHPPPPPPPSGPPPYYYSTESPLALPPPPPPPPPPPIALPLPPPPPPPAYNPYSTQPPPNYNPYHSCNNYPNNRFNYQCFYYSNQSNGWPAVRGNMGGGFNTAYQQQVEPAPYIEHQNAKKVRNDVNLHKDTLRLQIDDHNPDSYLVSFVFDALFDGRISIFYFAKDEGNGRFAPVHPEVHMPVRIPFQKGLGQKFFQPSGTGIDLGFFELDDLAKPSSGEDVFPLVIVAEAGMAEHSTGGDDSESNRTGNMQITQAVLEKKNSEPFQVRVVRQILWIDGVKYELRELYGIGSSADEGFNDCDPAKECVICMTEQKDTAVLPCRHMCMCSDCAKELRLQSNKCPICRQPIEELIEIKINNGTQ